MSSMAVLERAGVTVASIGVEQVLLTPPAAAPQTFRLVVRKQPPRPSSIPTPPSPDRCLLYAPHISTACGDALTRIGWSWLSDDACDLRADEWSLQVARPPREPATPTGPQPRRGRPAAATWSVVRHLTTAERPLRQRELAAAAGATQGRVSQILNTLRTEGLVERTERGWLSTDPRRLAAWFLEQYPGTGGIESWWFHLDPVAVQVDAILATHPEVVVSGDAAADKIAAWRSPTHSVVYSSALIDLRPLGFVPAEGLHDGTVLLIAAPLDTSVLGVRNAHPLQVAHDLRRLGGADRSEAADRVVGAALR